MVAMNSGPVLHAADLPTGLQTTLLANQAERLARSAIPPQHEQPALGRNPEPPAVVPLEETEKQAILNALHYTAGDRAQAAQLLGIGRTTLYRKLKQYKL
jgi:two-component system response regulator HydG